MLEEGCRFLQSNPASPFVQNAVVQRWRNDVHSCLRGRVLTTVKRDGKDSNLIPNASAYVKTLHEVFGLDIPEIAALWPQITARHEEVVSEKFASPD